MVARIQWVLKSSICPFHVMTNWVMVCLMALVAVVCAIIIHMAWNILIMRIYYIYICDGFKALAAVSPGCLATVVKSHRTWIPPLCFHPPAQCNANGGPWGSHLNPPSNGALAPARVPPMRAPPKFSIKAVHTAARGSLLVSRWFSHI